METVSMIVVLLVYGIPALAVIAFIANGLGEKKGKHTDKYDKGEW